MVFFVMSLRPTVIFYCDLDGVLTDFETHLQQSFEKIFGKNSIWGEFPLNSQVQSLKSRLGKDWYKMTASLPETFWSEMPWTSDGRELWQFIRRYPHVILTTPALSMNSRIGKKIWIENHLGEQVERIIQPNKHRFVRQNLGVPKNILNLNLQKVLIDDLTKNVESWKAHGGVGILHESTENTLKSINELFPWLSV